MPEIDEESGGEFGEMAEEKFLILKKFVQQMSEHFENVQCFVSCHRGDGLGTFSAQFGSGNIYARQGQAREWCIKQDELSREEVRYEGD